MSRINKIKAIAGSRLALAGVTAVATAIMVGWVGYASIPRRRWSDPRLLQDRGHEAQAVRHRERCDG
jgi:hypothetical protein